MHRDAASRCRLRRRWRKPSRVLGHEIVHAFQFDIARRHGGDTGQPLWFIEGMAEYLARGSLDTESSLWLRDAILSDRIPVEAERGRARALAVSVRPCVLGVSRPRFGDDVVEKALKPGPEAATAERSHALRDRRGSRRAV